MAPCVRRCAMSAWLVVLGRVVEVEVRDVGRGMVMSLEESVVDMAAWFQLFFWLFLVYPSW